MAVLSVCICQISSSFKSLSLEFRCV
ncbi:hypothetical protein LINPERPRIM_LOCUS5203 [Linum perenne]